MKYSFRPIELALLLLPLATGCAIPSADIIPRYGQLDIDGHFGVTEDPGPIPVTDLGEAGFGDDDGYFGARADFDFGSPILTISGQQSTHKGRGTIDVDLDASDGMIAAGSTVDTDMDFSLYQMAVTFDLIPTDVVDAGLGLGVTLVNVDATLTDVSTLESVEVDEFLPIPVLVARVGVDLGDFEAVGLASGFDLSTNGDSVSNFDLDLLARYRLFGGDDRLAGSLGIGYRFTKLGIDYDDDGDRIDVDIRLNGPYLAFVFSL